MPQGVTSWLFVSFVHRSSFSTALAGAWSSRNEAEHESRARVCAILREIMGPRCWRVAQSRKEASLQHRGDARRHPPRGRSAVRASGLCCTRPRSLRSLRGQWGPRRPRHKCGYGLIALLTGMLQSGFLAYQGVHLAHLRHGARLLLGVPCSFSCAPASQIVAILRVVTRSIRPRRARSRSSAQASARRISPSGAGGAGHAVHPLGARLDAGVASADRWAGSCWRRNYVSSAGNASFGKGQLSFFRCVARLFSPFQYPPPFRGFALWCLGSVMATVLACHRGVLCAPTCAPWRMVAFRVARKAAARTRPTPYRRHWRQCAFPSPQAERVEEQGHSCTMCNVAHS